MKVIFSLYIGIFLGLITLNYINVSFLTESLAIKQDIVRDVYTVEQIKFYEFDTQIASGEASYYSRNGCLGCSANLLMANSQPLDDNRNTIALTPEIVAQNKLLNKFIVVENLENGKKIFARVTDTGGFKKYNRVADLSVYTKQALGCGGKCLVSIKTR